MSPRRAGNRGPSPVACAGGPWAWGRVPQTGHHPGGTPKGSPARTLGGRSSTWCGESGGRGRTRGVATRTPLGVECVSGRGGPEGLAVPGMARVPARVAGRGRGRTRARLLGGSVRRRRPGGGGRVRGETGLQRCDTGAEWCQVVRPGAEVRLERGWGLLPVLVRHGKRPHALGASRRRIPRISRRRPRVQAFCGVSVERRHRPVSSGQCGGRPGKGRAGRARAPRDVGKTSLSVVRVVPL